MKKLLTLLIVVLAMTSAADATVLTWSADSITATYGAKVVVQLIASDNQIWASAKSVGNSPSSVATIASIVALPAAGPDAVVQNPSQTGYPGWWWVQAMDYDPPSDISSGAQFNVTIQCWEIGSFAFNSDYYGTNDILEITHLPEPSSVLLLALSSLALLRKRRR